MICFMNSRNSSKMIASLGTFLQLFSKSNQKSRNLHSCPCGWTIAVGSFCSSFCHQEMSKQSSYISLWNALLRILRLPMIANASGQCYNQRRIQGEGGGGPPSTPPPTPTPYFYTVTSFFSITCQQVMSVVVLHPGNIIELRKDCNLLNSNFLFYSMNLRNYGKM